MKLLCGDSYTKTVAAEDCSSVVATQVRVGQAVETVGQAGKPKTISGFQTHTSPVLLSVGDRAELATEEYIPLTNVLEGTVLLKKNPNYKAKDEKKETRLQRRKRLAKEKKERSEK